MIVWYIDNVTSISIHWHSNWLWSNDTNGKREQRRTATWLLTADAISSTILCIVSHRPAVIMIYQHLLSLQCATIEYNNKCVIWSERTSPHIKATNNALVITLQTLPSDSWTFVNHTILSQANWLRTRCDYCLFVANITSNIVSTI